MRARQLSVIAAAILAWSGSARALEAEVDSSTSAQWYSVQNPWADVALRRQRFVSTLGLTVLDLSPKRRPDDPELSFRARLRFDSDLGQESVERNLARGDRYVPNLRQTQLDVMSAYLEGKRYLDGVLGFRLGRQYVIDPIGWWSFDGALLSATAPQYVGLDLYGGWEQRSSMLLSTQRYEADGVWRGDRQGLDTGRYPSLLEERRLAPAWGVSAYATGLQWLRARASYRKVWNRDVVYVSQFPDRGAGYTRVGGARVSSERAGISLGADAWDLGAVETNAVWDLYTQRLAELAGRVDVFATEELSLGIGVDYFVPIFDADSIWNFFSQQPTTTGSARGAYQFSRNLDMTLSGGVRSYRTEGDPQTYAQTGARDAASLVDVLGAADLRRRWDAGSFGIRATGQTGERGHRYGADATLRQRFDGGLYDTLGVLSLHDWSDALRPDRDATSFSYVVGGGVSPVRRTRLGLEWEHSVNRIVGQRFRVLATLDVAVMP